MLKDYMNGPIWILWIVFALFAVLSIVLLTGRGAGLIAGYNTADKKEKEKYDVKKLCRIIGIFMAVIAALILVMCIWNAVLPVTFSYVFVVIAVVGSVVMIVLANTVCKKKK